MSRALHISTAILSCGILCIALCAILLQPRSRAASAVIVNGRTIRLEIAATPAAMARGLSGRASLDQEAGMLFMLPYRGIHAFWMKGMEFPLDIIWLDEGQVVEVATLPAPTSSSYIPRHDPVNPADRVLELNAGRAKLLDIRPGTTIGI